MSDLIDRQDAIDAHCELCGDKDSCNHVDICPDVEVFRLLPSAQPELLKCKDCYWWTKQEDSMQGRCARYKFYPTGYWYCAAARERRTDG